MTTETQIDDLTKVLVGIDAGRRVGWAKFYDEAEAHGRTRRIMVKTLGIASRVAQELSYLPLTKRRYAEAFSLAMETLLDEANDWGAYREGQEMATIIMKHQWGGVQGLIQASSGRQGAQAKEHHWMGHQFKDERHCGRCQKLLTIVQAELETKAGVVLSIKCHRCGFINELTF